MFRRYCGEVRSISVGCQIPKSVQSCRTVCPRSAPWECRNVTFSPPLPVEVLVLAAGLPVGIVVDHEHAADAVGGDEVGLPDPGWRQALQGARGASARA
jgi:hypothetical protein